jgi:hypothetical protein
MQGARLDDIFISLRLCLTCEWLREKQGVRLCWTCEWLREKQGVRLSKHFIVCVFALCAGCRKKTWSEHFIKGVLALFAGGCERSWARVQLAWPERFNAFHPFW